MRVIRSRHLWGAVAILMFIGAPVQPTAADSSKTHLKIFSLVRTRVRAIALTFDDGPDPDITPRVVAMLNRYGARATFFVTGSNAIAHPELIDAELRVGEIGNHTWNHADLSKIAARAVPAEIDDTDMALQSLLWEKPLYFRPPFGKLPHAALGPLERAGHEVVRWTVAIDKFRWMALAAAAREIAGRVRPGSIVLAHDACPPHDSRAWCNRVRNRSLDVLDRVLKRLTARGWRIVTVSELRALRGR